MNLQSTHHLKPVKVKKTKTRRTSQRKRGNWKMLLPMLLLIGVVFALAAGLVRLNSETESLNRKASSLKTQIHRQTRCAVNSNIKLASLKGEVIFSQIKRFKLHLRNPTVGQIRRLRVTETTERKRVIMNREPHLLLSRR